MTEDAQGGGSADERGNRQLGEMNGSSLRDPIPPSSVYYMCKDPFPEVTVAGSRTQALMSICMALFQPTALFMHEKGES